MLNVVRHICKWIICERRNSDCAVLNDIFKGIHLISSRQVYTLSNHQNHIKMSANPANNIKNEFVDEDNEDLNNAEFSDYSKNETDEKILRYSGDMIGKNYFAVR